MTEKEKAIKKLVDYGIVEPSEGFTDQLFNKIELKEQAREALMIRIRNSVLAVAGLLLLILILGIFTKNLLENISQLVVRLFQIGTVIFILLNLKHILSLYSLRKMLQK